MISDKVRVAATDCVAHRWYHREDKTVVTCRQCGITPPAGSRVRLGNYMEIDTPPSPSKVFRQDAIIDSEGRPAITRTRIR